VKMEREALGPDYDARSTSRPRTRPGTSACAWCPTATSSTPCSAGRASVVTDGIERITRDGRAAAVGRELRGRHHRVTATGLELQFLSDLALSVDGKKVVPADTVTYKGMMFSDVPNLASPSATPTRRGR
jgi:monooxygenase